MRRSYRRTAAGARRGGRAGLGARGAGRSCADELDYHDLQGGASTGMRSACTLQHALARDSGGRSGPAEQARQCAGRNGPATDTHRQHFK